MLKKIKRKLSNGVEINLAGYRASFRINRLHRAAPPNNPMLVELDIRQANYLRSKFDVLKQFAFPVNADTATDLLKFYYTILPILNADAREVAIRNALFGLQAAASNELLHQHATIEIAKSDLRNGIPDRCKILHGSEMDGALALALAESDAAYGAKLVTGSWPDASRGHALKYFFQNHEHLLRGKRILHFSPEGELRAWIESIRTEASIDYVTSNIVGSDVDTNQDLTDLRLQGQFDVVICHRVLEHVLDDTTAMEQLFRILAPGGLMSVSVPQSMQMARTCEWNIPDDTHHGHVRHYGADFSERLSGAGFRVIEERWLLDQTEERLKANSAFPLRMYLAYKPA